MNDKTLFRSKIILAIVIVGAFSFALGVAVGKTPPERLGIFQKQEISRSFSEDNYSFFRSVIGFILSNHIDRDKIDSKEILYSALEGAAFGLKDPYSVFLRPQIREDFFEELNGSFEGIGVEIGIRDGKLVVISPLEGSPGERAGIKPGDFIITIDGKPTLTLTLDQAVEKIRGPADTKVVLGIERAGQSFEMTITRGSIQVDSVSLKRRADGIVVMRVRQFNQDLNDQLKRLPREVLKDRTFGIIVDLRNNSGGFLETAVDFANLWIDKGVIVSEENAAHERTNYLAADDARFKGIPTVIIVNAGSASASEIFAGALQDYGLAKIVGEKTFGKGSVQELSTFADGSAVKITVARWFTPKGNSIDQTGITPDAVVEMGQKEYDEGEDPQMDKALEILKK